jgi:hypothetical protein
MDLPGIFILIVFIVTLAFFDVLFTLLFRHPLGAIRGDF